MSFVTVIFEDGWFTEVQTFFNLQYGLLLLERMQFVNILKKVHVRDELIILHSVPILLYLLLMLGKLVQCHF